MQRIKSKEVDRYIATFPKETQLILRKMRIALILAAPMAQEKISYGMPTLAFERKLVSYGAYKGHIGFYPGAAAILKFRKELAGYKMARGSVRFPLDEPLPLNLVGRMLKFRVKQELARKK